jgi:hypothetical protein
MPLRFLAAWSISVNTMSRLVKSKIDRATQGCIHARIYFCSVCFRIYHPTSRGQLSLQKERFQLTFSVGHFSYSNLSLLYMDASSLIRRDRAMHFMRSCAATTLMMRRSQHGSCGEVVWFVNCMLEFTSGKQGFSPGSFGASVPVAQPELTNRDWSPIFSPGCYTNRD